MPSATAAASESHSASSTPRHQGGKGGRIADRLVGGRALGSAIGIDPKPARTRFAGASANCLPAPQLRAGGRQRLSSKVLLTTLTELSAIAAPASTGLSRPSAASGMPTVL